MTNFKIVFDHVWWKYSGSNSWSLQDICLEVNEGEFVVVTGSTGAGKTSLCRLVNGLIPHGYPGTLRGRVFVNGKDTVNETISTLSNDVAMVFEDPESQIIWTNVADEVVFGLENRRFSKDEIDRRMQQVLGFLSLLDKKDKTPFELSGGQKQRLALASALAVNPLVILLDEPTSQMDPVGRREVFEAIDKIRKEHNSTIIIVEHNLAELIPVADRMVLISDGKLLLSGSPQEYYENLDLIRKFKGPIPEMVELGHKLRDLNLIESPSLTLESLCDQLKNSLELSRIPPSSSSLGDGTLGEYTTSGNYSIEASKLCYTYPDGTTALREINLKVSAGEFLGIIGVNGSGKTTLAKTFNGLLKPTGGEIKIFGKPVSAYSSEEIVSIVGHVFQNPIHQIASRTVFDEIAFGMRNLRKEEFLVSERVNSLLARFDLERYKGDHPYTLSRADQFRITLSSVLAMDPRILIVDEPTTGQDQQQSYQIMNALKEENEKGKTVIIITHHLRFIAEYVPRVVVMLDGKIILDGPTRDAFSNYELLKNSQIDPPTICKLSKILSLNLNGEPPLTVDEAVRAIVAQAKSQPLKQSALS